MNVGAVVVAAIVQIVIGSLWYGPLFGKTWMSMMGITPGRPSGGMMARMYGIQAVGSLVTAWVLARLVGVMGANTIGAGVQAGFYVWLGFIATVTLASVLYERRSWNLYILNNAYQLVSLAVMGGILAAWS